MAVLSWTQMANSFNYMDSAISTVVNPITALTHFLGYKMAVLVPFACDP